MSASAGAIRMGRAFVEISGDTTLLKRSLEGASSQMKSWGAGLMGIGSAMLGTGMSMAAALVPAIVQFANYEQALADLRAAAGPELTGRFEDIKAKIEEIAKATGIGPVEVTQAFSELLKAGKTVDQVLGGLGETTVKFARVSGMGMAETATILADALNVFSRDGTTAAQAANIMNQAADASTISLKDVADSFAAGGSVMGMFNQSMLDTATAIGIMGNAGVKGAVAGTALKTLMTRLATGVGEAGEEAGQVGAAMTEMGLSIYGVNGQILPFAQILERIETGLAGRTLNARNILMTQLAGARGILGLAPLLVAGTAGFAAFQTTMGTAFTVEQKFAIMTDTLWGALKKLWVHIQFVAIEIGAALAPALRTIGLVLFPLLSMFQHFIKGNQNLVQVFAFDAVKAIAFGAALMVLGGIIDGIGVAIGVVSTILTALPFLVILGGVVTILYLLLQLFPEVGTYLGGAFSTAWREAAGMFRDAGAAIAEAFRGIPEMIEAGDMESAFQTGILGMEILWLQFKDFWLQVWDEIIGQMGRNFDESIADLIRKWNAIPDWIARQLGKVIGVATDFTVAPSGAKANLTVADTQAAAAVASAAGYAALAEAQAAGLPTQGVWLAAQQAALAEEIRRRTQAVLDADAIAQAEIALQGSQAAVGGGGNWGDLPTLPLTPAQQRQAEIDRLRARQEEIRQASRDAADLDLLWNMPNIGPNGLPIGTTPTPTPDAGAMLAAAAFGSFSGGAISGFGIGTSPAERTATAAELLAQRAERQIEVAESQEELLERLLLENGMRAE